MLQPRAPILLPRAMLGQAQIHTIVARLRRREAAVEVVQWSLQPRRQPDETLVRARFDQCSAQKQIDQPAGVRAARRGTQAVGVARRSQADEWHVELLHHLLHLLEVPQLFARQARESIGELQIVGVREDQAQRGGRSLLLAVRVIDQQLAPALARHFEPQLRRRRVQDVVQRNSSIFANSALAEARRCIGSFASSLFSSC
jgi:hypothetical protein